MKSNRLSVIELDQQQWQDIAPRFLDFNFEQSLEYSLIAANRIGGTSLFFAIKSESDVIAVASVRIKTIPGLRFGIAYCAGGPLTHAPGVNVTAREIHAVITALSEELSHKRRNVFRFRLPVLPPINREEIDSLIVSDFASVTESVKPYSTFIIDLTPDIEQLRKNLHAKWRGHLNKSDRADLIVENGKSADLLSRFLNLYKVVSEAKEFTSDLAPELFLEIEDPHLNVEILIAKHENSDVGGIIVTKAGKIALYHYGATIPAGRNLRVGYHLTWYAMLAAREAGYKWYDLGGVDENENPGVHEFKSRAGGQFSEAPGPYEVMPTGAVGHMIVGAEKLYKAIRN